MFLWDEKTKQFDIGPVLLCCFFKWVLVFSVTQEFSTLFLKTVRIITQHIAATRCRFFHTIDIEYSVTTLTISSTHYTKFMYTKITLKIHIKSHIN